MSAGMAAPASRITTFFPALPSFLAMSAPATPEPTMTTSGSGKIWSTMLLPPNHKRVAVGPLGPVTELHVAVAHRMGLCDAPDQAVLVGFRRQDRDGSARRWDLRRIGGVHERLQVARRVPL